MMKPLHSSRKHDWETPQDLFDQLNAEFKFNKVGLSMVGQQAAHPFLARL